VGEYKDIGGTRGIQYNETYTVLKIMCPHCTHIVHLKEDDFTEYELNLICQETSARQEKPF
jgi:hypothetical protein